ncbi:MAG: hypothetical protein ABI543_03625 [Ignavibacteria bacterium]
MIFNTTKYYIPDQIFRNFIKRNIILLLTVISFFVIGFDLATEMAVAKNEVEYCTAILINASNPSNQPETPQIKKTEKSIITLFINNNTALTSSELSETFQSRPPPIA